MSIFGEKGNPLKPSDHGWQDAFTQFIFYSRGSGHSVWASQYINAAEVLVSRIEEPDIRAEHFFFPIFYLARHAIELKLKELLRWVESNFGEELESDLMKRHELYPLWNKAKKTMLAYEPAPCREDLAIVEAVIQAIHSLDRDGQLRYPSRTNGTDTFSNPPGQVSLSAFIDRTKGVVKYLDATMSAWGYGEV